MLGRVINQFVMDIDLRIMGRVAAPSILVERSADALPIWRFPQLVSLRCSALRLGALLSVNAVAGQAAGAGPGHLLSCLRGQSATVSGPAPSWNSTKGHVKGQLRHPHLLSWHPIVSAPRPSVGHGSTAHPHSSPLGGVVAEAVSGPAASAVHTTDNGRHPLPVRPRAVRALRPHGKRGSCLPQCQDTAHLRQQQSFAGVEQSIRANFDKAFRQHVRKKPSDEGVGWQRGPFPRPRFALGVTKGDSIVRYLLNAIVTQRNAKDVCSQILQSAWPTSDGPAVYHPRLGPNARLDLARPRPLA
jgi:hypothetical protein